MLILLTFVLLAEMLLRIRAAHYQAARDAHRETFQKLTAGPVSFDLPFSLRLIRTRAARLRLSPRPPRALSLRSLTNHLLEGSGRGRARTYVGPYGRIGTVNYSAHAVGLRAPWGWSTSPAMPSQTFLEARRFRNWYYRGMKESIGRYRRPLKLDPSR